MTSQIQGMSANNRREWLEHLMATVDAADALDRSLESMEEETQMTVVAEEEDFLTTSG
jgi:truncated hemoglobin YjbI